MKTISLTEEAYERLAAWKTGTGDSFSKVVDRMIPKRGTLGAVLEGAQGLPILKPSSLDRIEAETRVATQWKDQRDPWIS